MNIHQFAKIPSQYVASEDTLKISKNKNAGRVLKIRLYNWVEQTTKITLDFHESIQWKKLFSSSTSIFNFIWSWPCSVHQNISLTGIRLWTHSPSQTWYTFTLRNSSKSVYTNSRKKCKPYSSIPLSCKTQWMKACSSATRALSSKLFTYCITWRYTGENTRKIIPIPLSLCKFEQVRE